MSRSSPAADGFELVDLPRVQAGSSPQHLLTTMLGGYWYGQRAALPSAALVSLLGEFGVSEVSARTALSRLARRGLLETDKQGRRTSYALTATATDLLQRGIRRMLSFGADESSWSGRWTIASFSVPEEQRAVRHLLRTRLIWLGFGPLYDGVWVSPHDRTAQATAVLRDLGVQTATVFQAALVDDNPVEGSPIRAWDLDTLGDVYRSLVVDYQPVRTRLRAGRVSETEALIVRTALVDSWRSLPSLDPELPVALLPPDWPRREARELFIELYDGLAQLAQRRVVEVVHQVDPASATLVRSHTSDFVG